MAAFLLTLVAYVAVGAAIGTLAGLGIGRMAPELSISGWLPAALASCVLAVTLTGVYLLTLPQTEGPSDTSLDAIQVVAVLAALLLPSFFAGFVASSAVWRSRSS